MRFNQCQWMQQGVSNDASKPVFELKNADMKFAGMFNLKLKNKPATPLKKGIKPSSSVFAR